MRTRLFVVAAWLGHWACATFSADAIDAERGKDYRLTKDHGPWMVMVATFRDVDRDRKKDGLSPDEAAQELVLELRQQGIPAYVHRQDTVVERFNTINRRGESDQRAYHAQYGMVSVLAGNYPAVDDATAQKTLAFVKKFFPTFLKDEKSGGIYRVSANRHKGPLGGAFMTVNPMVNPTELAKKEKDPLLLKLNSGISNALVSAPGKYTLRVALFTGRKASFVGAGGSESDRKIEAKIGSDNKLNEIGEEAAQLAQALRNQKDKKHDAFVYHDHHQSYVTVGTFDSPHDPGIRALAAELGGKMRTHAQTQQPIFAAEAVVLRGRDGKPVREWMLDPKPQLIEIPRLK